MIDDLVETVFTLCDVIERIVDSPYIAVPSPINELLRRIVADYRAAMIDIGIQLSQNDN